MNCFLQKRDWMDYINFFINIVVLISIIVGFYFSAQELKNSNQELKKLNTKAQIDIKFKPVDPEFSVGPQYTEPIDIKIIPRNVGDYSTGSWLTSLMFCENTRVVNSDPNWINTDPLYNQYFLESKRLISKDQHFFNDEYDSIGKFSIIIPSKGIIPIAIAHSSGERTKPIGSLILFDWSDRTFQYKEILCNDGKCNIEGCSMLSKRE